jgi:predicted GTPase
LDFLASLDTTASGEYGIRKTKEIHRVEYENEGKQSDSKTTMTTKYLFRIGHGNFTVLDTPGFGDTNGLKRDKENFENIKETLLKEGGINCICVIQSGRDSRITT